MDYLYFMFQRTNKTKYPEWKKVQPRFVFFLWYLLFIKIVFFMLLLLYIPLSFSIVFHPLSVPRYLNLVSCSSRFMVFFFSFLPITIVFVLLWLSLILFSNSFLNPSKVSLNNVYFFAIKIKSSAFLQFASLIVSNIFDASRFVLT